MKTVLKKTITLETKRHDFPNEFAYIEQWSNKTLKDCFFAEKEFLFADGTLKNGGRKYFYSYDKENPEKTIEPIVCENFTDFDQLCFLNENLDVETLFTNE